MKLEFELEERTGNGKEASYTVLRKGIPAGSLILNEEYRRIELEKLQITGRTKR